MAKIFLSHSHHNNVAAIALRDWLVENGWDDLFLDLDPRRGLVAGQRWQEALRKAANRCEAVIFLISPAWLGSDWAKAEFLLAKTLNKLIFGVIIEPVPMSEVPVEMTSEWQLCDLTTTGEFTTFFVNRDDTIIEVKFSKSALDSLRIGLSKAGISADTFEWPPRDDPDRQVFRGLSSLEEKDAAIFFGRDADIIQALDKLRGIRLGGKSQLFVILGASGAGKSSFLRAGVLPRLRRDDRHFMVLPVVRPRNAAISGQSGLLSSLQFGFEEVGKAKTRKQIRDMLARGVAGFRDLLSELEHRKTASLALTDAHAAAPSIVLPIDQGEELFSLDGQDEARVFLDLLRAALLDDQLIVVMTHRSDAYEQLQTDRSLKEVQVSLFNLPPMLTARLHQVIEGPLERLRQAGTGNACDFDKALVNRLLEDVERADSLPLLAFTLERLWLEHRGKSKIDLRDFHDIGGFEGSIDAAVRRAIDAVAADGGDASATDKEIGPLRRAFIPWLVQINRDTQAAERRLARRDDIPLEARGAVDALVNARLLVSDVRRVDDRDEVVLEVTHEAFFRHWRPLAAWIEQEKDLLRTLDDVKRAAHDWADATRKGSPADWLLHRGGRLTTAESMLTREDFRKDLGDQGVEYLRACRAAEDASAHQLPETEPSLPPKWRRTSGWAYFFIPILWYLNFNLHFDTTFWGAMTSVQIDTENLIFPFAAWLGARFGPHGVAATAIGCFYQLYGWVGSIGNVDVWVDGRVGDFATAVSLALLFGQPRRVIETLSADRMSWTALAFTIIALGFIYATPRVAGFLMNIQWESYFLLIVFLTGLSSINGRRLLYGIILFGVCGIILHVAGLNQASGSWGYAGLLLDQPWDILQSIAIYMLGRGVRLTLFATVPNDGLDSWSVELCAYPLMLILLAVGLAQWSVDLTIVGVPEGKWYFMISIMPKWYYIFIFMTFVIGLLEGYHGALLVLMIFIIFGVMLDMLFPFLILWIGQGNSAMSGVFGWYEISIGGPFHLPIGGDWELVAMAFLGAAVRRATRGLHSVSPGLLRV